MIEFGLDGVVERLGMDGVGTPDRVHEDVAREEHQVRVRHRESLVVTQFGRVVRKTNFLLQDE